MAYIDLLSQDSHVLINVNIARIFGLSTAVYWGELLNVLGKVKDKKTHDENGFFKLDRKYIEKKTTLTLEEQLLCDHYLIQAEILHVAESDTDTISVDVEAMIALIAHGDVKKIEALTKATKKNKQTKAQSRTAAIQKNLKAGIKEPEPFKTALINWLDALFANKKFITKAMVDTFVNTFKTYTADPSAQVKIVELAMQKTYTVAEWAIEIYQKLKASGQIGIQKISTGLDSNNKF